MMTDVSSLKILPEISSYAKDIKFTAWTYDFDDNTKKWMPNKNKRPQNVPSPYILPVHDVKNDWVNAEIPQFGSKHYDVDNSIARIKLFFIARGGLSLDSAEKIHGTFKEWFKVNADDLKNVINGSNSSWLQTYFNTNNIEERKQDGYIRFVDRLKEMHSSNVLKF